jgi:ssDNA-binding Zn-finger/Zn-ribbon topoisomerase 1
MKPSNLKCPECSGDMVPRTNKTNGTKFWGCKNYPYCKGTRDSLGESKYDKQIEVERGNPNDIDKPSRRYD